MAGNGGGQGTGGDLLERRMKGNRKYIIRRSEDGGPIQI